MTGKTNLPAGRQVAVSGIKASGVLHIGNYIGAIEQFVRLQSKYKMFVFIADLHAITVPQDPNELRENTLNVAALYIACGLDLKKTILFVQSHVPAHVELGWILNTLTPLGELERMTQFKDKSQDKGVLAGLLNYPTLMAADILLYRPDIVPVGEDQVQHVELTRTLARKFNSRFGSTFKEPKELLRKEGARIMAIDNPTKKMSKSAGSNNYIALTDEPDIIRKKIKTAVTDSGSEIKYDVNNKPGISNLLSIYSAFSGESIASLEKKYAGKNYGTFKSDLAELLVQKLSPIQEKYKSLLKNKKSLMKILDAGAKSANKVAEKTMAVVHQKIGLI
ncbi:tryptophan--tRNA ligase [Candidatus Giovannonibacteria bacterium RIFCSPLOWO2_02_FULL_43_11b]|uniref:Tryptophan--tRNA ligase n=1 Tax=Candidatus Giovannonibacteria bacterium RIFCSPHIGHO2_12_FULL_43_15 TaxID=1798341 RepID=A0A1F5WNH8_9BACT|nr:MAG: tryptophan--tRNA ligase [Candidatus Giovannonibacteria bacterium RIFCSPHIGHO2_01_FULL_43_100]OGF66146.1 MAG: tryptophan--tRNA ligase [Candidatus Giovannonibacteria bacterium RIFCSPHIGHO2_02_FULL_43_32]OGF77262.1 MAG: tryptophan--tRNA ligase [Candidatus Giovannonibacteria bacterium RIFCSPHIGHO2_12_FULL_43_15]OGF78165.1 MAG: tryptophan--tRNA ligase [Candidatus Giovannonibacteria bacterium RIFCSPLOWO2_01_FULL_43_60]OGF89114.1 MAG: tryptophan--tRNA ligase [Candidatus Giovannonibacteria bact